MKTIVTHLAPDADAITSVWLLKRFHPDWKDTEIAFVPAGKTLHNDPVDSDPNIMHVDTGMGMLDHHQTDEFTCAAKRTLEFVSQAQSSRLRQDYGGQAKFKAQSGRSKNHKEFPDEALIRLVDVVNDTDHFVEASYPNPNADFYDFGFVSILDGWRLLYNDDHLRVAERGMDILDGIYKMLQSKVWAEKEIQEVGIPFETSWGKGIGLETINDQVIRSAQLQGYVIVVRKDPKKGFARIKALPNSQADLEKVYTILKKKDPAATWFLHASKKMVLNGSSKNPDSVPTKLTLREIVEVLKK